MISLPYRCYLTITNLHIIFFFFLYVTGTTTPPSYLSARVIESFWLFFTIIIAASYCGNLIAFLTVHVDKRPFRSVEGLVGQDQYKWGFTGGSVYVTLLKVFN